VVKSAPRTSVSFDPGIELVGLVLLLIAALGVPYGLWRSSAILRKAGYKRCWYRKKRDDIAGVSPIIGVILMVGITILIIALLWLWLGSLIAVSKSTPRVDFSTDRDANGNFKVIIEAVSRGRISIDDVTFRVQDPSGKYVPLSHNTIKQVYGESINSENDVVFCDIDLNGKLSAGDYFTIRAGDGIGEPDGKFILIYRPTGEIVIKATFS
jgi:FlaG/FlaF family flagellin (archaellin)